MVNCTKTCFFRPHNPITIIFQYLLSLLLILDKYQNGPLKLSLGPWKLKSHWSLNRVNNSSKWDPKKKMSLVYLPTRKHRFKSFSLIWINYDSILFSLNKVIEKLNQLFKQLTFILNVKIFETYTRKGFEINYSANEVNNCQAKLK